MRQPEDTDGTHKELGDFLQSGIVSGHTLGTILDPDTEDVTAGLPPPPFAVHDRDHVIRVLHEGMESLEAGSGIEITGSYWDDLLREISKRAARRGHLREGVI